MIVDSIIISYTVDSLVEYRHQVAHVGDREDRVEELPLPPMVLPCKLSTFDSGKKNGMRTHGTQKSRAKENTTESTAHQPKERKKKRVHVT